MFEFSDAMFEGTAIAKYKFMKLKYTLAETCYQAALHNASSGNVDLYNALSHLAQVPELNVNMVIYDGLQYNSSAKLDRYAIDYVESLLKQLEDLLKK